MVWHLVSGLKNAPVIARWTFFSKFWNLPSETSLWALGPKYGQIWGFLVVLTPQMAISHLVMTIGVGISQKKNIKNFDHVQIMWNDPYILEQFERPWTWAWQYFCSIVWYQHFTNSFKTGVKIVKWLQTASRGVVIIEQSNPHFSHLLSVIPGLGQD